MTEYHKKQNIFLLCGLFFTALCVCMLSPLNPLSGDIPNTDSSVFLTVARGMLRGKLPYVDFFDHKGPLVYFIDAAGLFIGGFTGVWLIELLLMFTAVIFAYKTAHFFTSAVPAFLGTAFSFVALETFFEGGNMTEEYVLPFIFISLYIFTKYFFTQTEPAKLQIGILGACFGISLLLRPNMFAVWLAFCAVILVQKLRHKEYVSLLRYTAFFLSGILLVLLPVLIYLKITGSFNECVNQYIAFNGAYAVSSAEAPVTFKEFVKSAIKVLNASVLPFIIAFFWLFKKKVDFRYGFYAGYALSFIFSFLLTGLSRRNYQHYNMVLIPLFVPAIAFCAEKLLPSSTLSKYGIFKFGIPILLLCFFFNEHILQNIRFIRENIKSDARNYYANLGKFIDKNSASADTISVFGNQCVVYLFTERESASKYIYQLPPAMIFDKIKDGYITDIQRTKPYLVIIPLGHDESMRKIFPSIFELIRNNYYECYISERHIIYKRK
jgi:hypothetical protein